MNAKKRTCEHVRFLFLCYQAAIPVRLESQLRQLELVGNTNLYTGDAVTVFSAEEFTHSIVIVVGVGNVTIQGSTFGQVIGITQSILPQFLAVATPGSYVLDFVVLDGSIQTAWAKGPFQTHQPLLLFGGAIV